MICLNPLTVQGMNCHYFCFLETILRTVRTCTPYLEASSQMFRPLNSSRIVSCSDDLTLAIHRRCDPACRWSQATACFAIIPAVSLDAP